MCTSSGANASYAFNCTFAAVGVFGGQNETLERNCSYSGSQRDYFEWRRFFCTVLEWPTALGLYYYYIPIISSLSGTAGFQTVAANISSVRANYSYA